MTLKEKFTNMVLDKEIMDNLYFCDADWEEECVKIADDFAIGFAEWLNGTDVNDEFLKKNISTKELLEIYKKENNLKQPT